MAKLTKFSLGQSYGDLVGKLNETIDAVGEVQDNPYTLPAATSTGLGGVKVGSNITNSSGTISLTKGNVTSALGYTPLQKLTYEETKELACGSNGKVCLGKFGAYDTNITIDIDSTTSTTCHATIVIHSQNVVANGTGGTVGCYVYGDADNHITPLISVFRPYGSASRQIEVYANLPGWSKNLVRVRAVALSTGEMTDVLTSVDTIPTAINGKITVTPINVLTTAFQPKGSYAGTSTATTSAAGLMSSADKTKLDGIATGANAYSLPLAASGTRGGIQVGYTASGANLPVALSNEKAYVSLTKNAVTSALGYTPPTTNTTYNVATTSADGLMSKTDKTRLDTLASYLTNYHDDYVDSLAEIMAIFDNYPQGASVVDALSGKVDKVSGKGLSTNDFTAAYKTKLDGIATGANNYSLPAATSSALGGVKIGSNITNSSGTISLTKANVTSALGYTPPTTDTTYSAATTSAAGLMSAADKTKVDNAVTLSDAQTISGAKTFSSHIKTAENVMGTKYRTHDSYETGVVYGTSGNEALTFAIQNPVTAFQIVYGTKPSAYASGTWQSVTPLFQTKDGKVIINRKIASSTDASNLKLFDVNGDANATTLYENGTSLANKYQAKGNYAGTSAATQSAAGLMSAADKTKLDGIATGANNFSLPTRLASSSSSAVASADSATEQGWHYIGTSDSKRPAFKQVDGQTGADYRVMTTAYGSTWWQQIATDFRSNDIFIRRSQNGSIQAWTPIVKMQQGANPCPTDNTIPRWDASRNATLQSSGITVDDSNNMSGVATLSATTIKENGKALSSKYASMAVATQASNGLMSAQDKQKLDGISSSAGSGGGFAYFATANILSDIYGFNKTYLAFGSTSSSGTNWRMAVIKTTNADEYGTGVPDLFITTSNSTSASHHCYNDGDGRYEGSVAGFGYCYIFVVQ